jgi:hypothetical protein
MSKTISARIDETLHNKLKDVCNNEGITVNDKLKQIIQINLNDSSYSIDDESTIQEKKIKSEHPKDDKKILEKKTSVILEEMLKKLDRNEQKRKEIDLENKIKSISAKIDNFQETIQTKEKMECNPMYNKSNLHCLYSKKSF